jgi:hypothetical protein
MLGAMEEAPVTQLVLQGEIQVESCRQRIPPYCRNSRRCRALTFSLPGIFPINLSGGASGRAVQLVQSSKTDSSLALGRGYASCQLALS